MWVDILLLLETPAATADQQQALRAALARRGWECRQGNAYESSIVNVQSDAAIVKLVERDVKEAVYVAGISGYSADCYLLNAPADAGMPGEFETQDSDRNRWPAP